MEKFSLMKFSYLEQKAVGGAGGTKVFKTVSELPEVGKEDVVYLVPSDKPEDNNVFLEVIWVDGNWETIGSFSPKGGSISWAEY